MGILEEYDTSRLCNETEAAVFRILYSYVEKRKGDPAFLQFCICQTCIMDIAAIALNHLPPHYRMYSADTPHALKQFHYLDSDLLADEVMKAIKIVMSSPHHY